MEKRYYISYLYSFKNGDLFMGNTVITTSSQMNTKKHIDKFRDELIEILKNDGGVKPADLMVTGIIELALKEDITVPIERKIPGYYIKPG
jgi:hypothetical protein